MRQIDAGHNSHPTIGISHILLKRAFCLLLGMVFVLPLADGRQGRAATAAPDESLEVRHGANARVIRVGLYQNKPKIFSDENGKPAGIFVGVLEEIARREGWQLRYVPCTWSQCLAGLEEGRIDLMPDVAFSVGRDRRFDFHQEKVIESWSQLYCRPGIQITNWSDLNGRRLALLKDSIQQSSLVQMIQGLGYDVSLVGTDSYDQAFQLAAEGRVDAAVTNHLFGDYYYRQYGLAKTALVFNSVSLYFASAQGINHDLLAAIDRTLLAMKSEPGAIYYRELAQWMARPPKVVVPRYLLWILTAIGALLVVSGLVIVVLRRQVQARTSKLVQANETLRQSEEKFRSIFHNHSAIKLIIDPDSGRIVEANDEAVNFYGWSLPQLRQMTIQDLSTEAGRTVSAKMDKALADKRVRFHCRQRLVDGAVKDVEVFCSSLDIQGKTLLHYIIHDISDHRRLEEQFRQAQKMEAVGRLAGGVAHDYNNMLSVILGYAELAMLKISPQDAIYDDLRQIRDAGRRSTNITRQLLAFAKRQEVSPQVVDLKESMAAMLNMLQRLIGEDINLALRLADDVWPVHIDPTQLDQMLANLCINGRDAIAGVGTITIETANVVFDEGYCSRHADCVAGDYVMLAVSDDGCGMESDTVENIFEPFFTTKDGSSGTGLGLATVYGIVKQNRGFINVYSEPGLGTTFKIYLPRYEGEVTRQQKAATAEPARGNNETILLVEDEQAIRLVSQRMLENLGYQVTAAASPAEALDLAKEQPAIDLLLTDVVLPEMNGSSLAAELQTRYPELKVLFMSGYTSTVISQRGGLAEQGHFIQKPFSMQDLAATVRDVLAP